VKRQVEEMATYTWRRPGGGDFNMPSTWTFNGINTSTQGWCNVSGSMEQRRHGRRPAHINFPIGGEGYRELVTALYFADDEHIDSDTVFGVSGSLVVRAVDDPHSPVPGLKAVHYDFRLARGRKGDGAGRRRSIQDSRRSGIVRCRVV
jgi:hypothetical protein